MKNKTQIIIISILILLSLIEIIPYIITIIFPKLCYGCSTIGKYHQELNNKFYLGYINWFAYTLLLLYIIFLSYDNKNKFWSFGIIILCFFLIYFPTLPLLHLITILLSSYYQNEPFIKNYENIFPQSKNIENASSIIINEFNEYIKNNKIDCIRKTNPGFKIENTNDDNSCWRALYLKKIGRVVDNMIKYFPNTTELIKDKQIHNAFFSILDPNVEIPPHVGYYKGYLRYHMGVTIPNNDIKDNNNKAYIVCGNEKYVWKENEGIMFDDMYLHYEKNPTNKMRVVLYLDVKRNSNNYFIDKLNDIGIYLIENSIIFNTFLKNQHSQNKIDEVKN